jgi:hypothetical protein
MVLQTKSQMKLSRIIFDKWKIWMQVPVKTNLWSLEGDKESLGFYDWYCMNFWYALNHDWYKMNNKMYAYTGCEDPYTEPRDFDDYEEQVGLTE